MILAAAIGGAVAVSLALIARPLLALLHGDDPTGKPCPACEVTRVCAPALELALGLLTGAWGLHVMLVPDIFRHGPFLNQLLEIVPQQAWGGVALGIAMLHASTLLIGGWARLLAIFVSYLWWAYLAQSAWPLWYITPAASTYTAMAMIAAVAGVCFGYERAHAWLA